MAEQRIYCKYCGEKLIRDVVGRRCKTRNCQWEHGFDEDGNVEPMTEVPEYIKTAVDTVDDAITMKDSIYTARKQEVIEQACAAAVKAVCEPLIAEWDDVIGDSVSDFSNGMRACRARLKQKLSAEITIAQKDEDEPQ